MNLLIIGAGAAGSVAAQKCAMQRDVFPVLHLASRTLSKCKHVQSLCNTPITISELDADDVNATVTLIREIKADIVINLALPYQDLAIMDACLATGAHYLDTANYEPKDEVKFSYSHQWAYQDKFVEKGITAVLGCGFDPGMTGIYTAYAQKHLLDEIHYIDIVDCNAGDHGKAFATNFNPEINIREVTQRGKYRENGQWIETEPLEIKKSIDYPEVGTKDSYLLYHEELESLAKHIKHVKRIRFWMTFGQEYIKHLDVLQNVGMTRIDPVMYEGKEIIPLQFLKALLPEPSSLAVDYTGKTSIGCIYDGIKDGKRRRVMLYNVCDHAQTHKELQAQAVSYTTGVPAATGAVMLAKGLWNPGAGVFNVEQLEPDCFMEAVSAQGLPWHVRELSIDNTDDNTSTAPA